MDTNKVVKEAYYEKRIELFSDRNYCNLKFLCAFSDVYVIYCFNEDTEI